MIKLELDDGSGARASRRENRQSTEIWPSGHFAARGIAASQQLAGNLAVLLFAALIALLALLPAIFTLTSPVASAASIPATIQDYHTAGRSQTRILASDYHENEIPAGPREYAEREGREGREGRTGRTGDDRAE